MEKILPEWGYFVLYKNNNILVYYPIISYQKIEVRRVEILDMSEILITHWYQYNIQMQ